MACSSGACAERQPGDRGQQCRAARQGASPQRGTRRHALADNAAYYRTSEEDARYYVDYTGTGNTLNMRHPHVLQLIMDSLRYWVREMHVDGFRFDLASTLAREL